MINAFCTIITTDHYAYAYVLIEKLQKLGKYHFFIYITDKSRTSFKPHKMLPNTLFLFNDDLCKVGIGKELYRKYAKKNMDNFRWSMKPLVMHHILEKKLASKVIYIDSDIYFFKIPDFLFSKLDKVHFLLTPHWRSSDPEIDTKHFLLLYTNGLYNAGFCGATKDAIPILAWWAKACKFFCLKNPVKGLYVDQVHLNLIPVYFENVEIIKHRGCNIAWWNRYECKRSRGKNNEVLINGKYPVIFIHFTKKTILTILKGDDPLLFPYLKEYTNALSSMIE